ncbi:hypothetical protein PQ478_08745 [Alkalihalophilus pseudofirmus]|uniref:hypothetical protein n=1 Tax=Alkalihalophilus pseudofirmus TaxID=79885 RepID=UPI00259BA631|nr:hypothetical protein [Alkalihalophilus pseudofirmus]WEG18557.1 hypothetical protein PQ478_08745 [Alkalihalophilus pseudofirmus]
MSAVLKLVEETKEVRDSLVEKVDVLSKVKQLSLLPDGSHMNLKQVADYYNVDTSTIKNVMSRYKTEFMSDGIRVLRGEKFRQYKERYLKYNYEYKKAPSMTLLTKKAILRMGMLLRDSEVSQKIREYLLNVENESHNSVSNNEVKYNGSWTKELIEEVLYSLNIKFKEEKPLIQSISEVAEEINCKPTTLITKWYKKDTEENPSLKTLFATYSEKKPSVKRKKETKEIIEAIPNEEVVKVNNTIESEEKIILDKMMGLMKDQNSKMEEMMTEVYELKKSNKNLNRLSQLLINDNKMLWDVCNGIVESNQEIKDQLVETQQSLSSFKEEYEKLGTENLEKLKNRIKLAQTKIKKAENENSELLKFIGKSHMLSSTYNTNESTERKTPLELKMDRNGNLNRM